MYGGVKQRSHILEALMTFLYRISSAARVASLHFLVCLGVVLVVGVLVFNIWYPYPYEELAAGRSIFILIVIVDIVCGPLLTFVIYSPQKPKNEIFRDIGFVVLIQGLALTYGINVLFQARPVWLAFEGDRYRVVTKADILTGSPGPSDLEFRSLSLTGPELVGVRLANPDEEDFLDSIQRALNGDHPSFRPDRWINYESQHEAVRAMLIPLEVLIARHVDAKSLIDQIVNRAGLRYSDFGYLPMAVPDGGDWVVLINRKSALPQGYLPLNGWAD